MRTKRYFLLFLSCLASAVIYGQGNADRFDRYKDMVKHDIKLYNIGVDGFLLEGVAYDESFKKVKGEALSACQEIMYVKGISRQNDGEYLNVRTSKSSRTFNLKIGSDFDLISNIRSVTYWKDKLVKAMAYKYITSDSYMLKSIESTVNKKGPMTSDELFLPVSWESSFAMPEHIDGEVIYAMKVNHGKKINISASHLDFFAKDFRTEKPAGADVNAFETTMPDLASTDKYRVCPATVDRSYLSEADLEKVHAYYDFYQDKDYVDNHYDKYIPITVFAAAGDKYKGFVAGKEVTVDSRAVKFDNRQDARYLSERKNAGESERRKKAQEYDKVIHTQFFDEHDADSYLFNLYLNNGQKAAAKGDFARAEANYDKALALRPENSELKSKVDELQKMKNDKKRKDDLLRKYGPHWGQLVYDGEYTLGMNQAMCLDIAGKGTYKVLSKTTSYYGTVREYWTYDSTSAYVVGGLLLGDVGVLAATAVAASYPDLVFEDGVLVEISY